MGVDCPQAGLPYYSEIEDEFGLTPGDSVGCEENMTRHPYRSMKETYKDPSAGQRRTRPGS